MKLLPPTSSEFASAKAALKAAMTSAVPDLMAKSGSLISELIVRPMAYLFSAISTSLSSFLTQTSAVYLLTSTATDSEAADSIASNYFITRKEAAPATGVLTLTMASPSIVLKKGSIFVVGDVKLSTDVDYVATNSDITLASEVVKLPVFVSVDGTGAVSYRANVPVSAPYGSEIPAGTKASAGFITTSITDIVVTSSVTGGRGVETDAELMRRCGQATANAGIGTVYGVRRLVQSSPFNVLDAVVAAGEDELAERGRYNTTNINPGGFVDCYVKTANQAVTDIVTIDVSQASSENAGYYEYSATVSGGPAAGALRIAKIYTEHGEVNDFQTEFSNSQAAPRLSSSQVMSVRFTSPYGDIKSAVCHIEKLPHISELQGFITGEGNRFIGQDIQVRSAVPVSVSLQFSVGSDATDEDIENVKAAIADHINSKAVGDCSINFSDLQSVCAATTGYSGLRVPCQITFSSYLKTGNRQVECFDCGEASISGSSSQQWPAAISFLSTTTYSIRVDNKSW